MSKALVVPSIEYFRNRILCTDALTLLNSLPSGSVHCIVTSPPYFNLRDYGTAKWVGGDANCDHVANPKATKTMGNPEFNANRPSREETKTVGYFAAQCPKCGAIREDEQIGLEDTPEAYITRLVTLFREARRVLRDDGVMFLNLGDSYASGVQRVGACGTSDKAPEDYRNRGCLCGNLCGVCRAVYRSRKSRSGDLLAPMLIASLSLSSPGHTGFGRDRLPTSDLAHRVNRILHAIPGLLRSGDHESARLRAFRESMPDEFSRQLLDLCLQRGDSSLCLLCARSLIGGVQESARMSHGYLTTSDNNQDNTSGGALSAHHSQNIDRACEYCSVSLDSPANIIPQRTLPPKNLLGIPWRVALALQSDGWILRSDIIWNKPNPMPESVKDRCTKSHEYVFMFAKSPRYFWDQEAVREPHKHKYKPLSWEQRKAAGATGGAMLRGANQQQGEGVSHDLAHPAGRNKRSVWTISTEPYSAAHFAVFPPRLVRPMILAGCPKGSIVLDPFMGAGTTGLVARRLGRDYVGCDLNPEYVAMARKRIDQEDPTKPKELATGEQQLSLFAGVKI